MQRTVAQALSSAIQARLNCIEHDNDEWRERHQETGDAIAHEYLPSGAGIDNGAQIDWSRSTGEKIVIDTSYHHINEVGYYDGWTDHTITVRASLLSDFRLKISGRNRNDIKEHLYEIFYDALQTPFIQTT